MFSFTFSDAKIIFIKFKWINITDFLEFIQQIVEELLHKAPPKMTKIGNVLNWTLSLH